MSHLPEISYKELISLIKHCKCEVKRGEGSPIIIAINKAGLPFTIHQHPSQKVYKAKLSKILKYASISNEEFWHWYHNEK